LMYSDYLQTTVLSQNIEDVIAFDFGTLYYTGYKDLRLSMSVRNFSRQGRFIQQRFELPLTMDIGIAMDLMPYFMGDNSGNKLTLAIDALHPRDYSERLHIGAEYALSDLLFLRGGYKLNYDEEGLCAGVGVNKMFGNFGVKFDYAFTDFGEFFGSVHRISWHIYMK